MAEATGEQSETWAQRGMSKRRFMICKQQTDFHTKEQSGGNWWRRGGGRFLHPFY
jgi:hypothetical protein